MELANPLRWLAGRWASRRELVFDLVLMLLVQAVTVSLIAPLLHLGYAGLVIELSTGFFLLFRRVAPLSVLLLMVLNTVGLTFLGRLNPLMLSSMIVDMTQGWMVLAVPFAAYSAIVYGTDRRRALLMIGIITLVAARPWDPGPVSRILGTLMVMLLPTLIGHYVAGLNDRVERAEREQHRLAEQARVEERVRLAAEMHDVVTHRISLMVLQAGALGVTATDTATRRAAEDLRAAGCQALDELRDLVGVLRSTSGEASQDLLSPRAGGTAGVPDFAELLGESESVGIPVTLEQDGDPTLASPVVARTTYRIVQESLTNVRKHAPGAATVVRLRYTADLVRLTVRNRAPEQRADAGLTASGSGTGLLGLRQRVELVSGTLATGATEDGGFQVDATLPAFVPTREDGVAQPANRAGEPGGPPARRAARPWHAPGIGVRPHRARGS